jgi:Tol biopolymer transport system component
MHGTIIICLALVFLPVHAFNRVANRISSRCERPTNFLNLYSYTIEVGSSDSLSAFLRLDMSKLRVTNLGSPVNSSGLDYAPTVSEDGRTLYFVSDRPGSMINKTGNRSHDFWMTKKTKGNKASFQVPTNIDTLHRFGPDLSINSRSNEGAASLSADGKILVFTGCVRPDGFGDCDLYIAEVEGHVWGKPRNLGQEVNTKYWESQPSISPDNNRIYFATNRRVGGDTSHNHDIWYADRDKSSKRWQKPVPLKAINTVGREWSPYIAADNKTLFFASSRHSPNYGGMDLFYVRKTGIDSQGKEIWSNPVNLGPSINTAKNEIFISVPASGEVIYWSSDRDDIKECQGEYDIYMADNADIFKKNIAKNAKESKRKKANRERTRVRHSSSRSDRYTSSVRINSQERVAKVDQTEDQPTTPEVAMQKTPENPVIVRGEQPNYLESGGDGSIEEYSQEFDNPDDYKMMYFVVLYESPNYDTVLKITENAEYKLGRPYLTEWKVPDSKNGGLVISKDSIMKRMSLEDWEKGIGCKGDCAYEYDFMRHLFTPPLSTMITIEYISELSKKNCPNCYQIVAWSGADAVQAHMELIKIEAFFPSAYCIKRRCKFEMAD